MSEVAHNDPACPSVERCGVAGVLVVTPRRHRDSRGHFFEAYNQNAFRKVGVECHFIQDNQSFSRRRGTIRGMHFQIPPFAQSKLVRVLRGSIFDVAVDIRSSSPTFGQFMSVELTADKGRQLFVPAGFAHGFCTLEPDTEVFYKVDAPYSREHERGLRWNSSDVGINWPALTDESTLLERDRWWPELHGVAADF